MEAQQLLRDNTSKSNGVTFTTLTIEYDVSIMDSVKYANGPLLVEIDRCETSFFLCEIRLDENFLKGTSMKILV